MQTARELAFRTFAIAFALVLLESGLRIADLPDTCWLPIEEVWVPDDALGFAYRPGARVAGGVVNALGLRGPVPPVAKPADERRVLYVGDSTVWGFRVADAATFWSLATGAVGARHPDRAITPLVAAAPGYSSYHSRVLLDRMLAWHPDAVVFYVGAYNDHRRRRYYPDAAIPDRMRRRRAGWHDVRVLRAIEYATDRLGKWIAYQLREPGEPARVPPDAFEANLRHMIAATRAAGAQPLLLVPPFPATLVRRHPAIPRYREILLRAAEELGVEAVDLGPRFQAAGQRDLFLAGDDFHPGPAGHRVIAETIAAHLALD